MTTAGRWLAVPGAPAAVSWPVTAGDGGVGGLGVRTLDPRKSWHPSRAPLEVPTGGSGRWAQAARARGPRRGRGGKTAALDGPAARCVLGGWTSLRLISMSRRRGRGPRAAPALRADACPEAVGAVTLTRGIGQRTECGPSDYESDHESGRRIAAKNCCHHRLSQIGRKGGRQGVREARRSPTRR